MPYKLFIGQRNYSSWSLRPWIMMRTMGLDFETEFVPVTGMGTKAELGKKHPLPSSLVPCLYDGEFAVWDSLAILEYLHDKHPEAGVWPADAAVRARARCWASEMHSGFGAVRSVLSMNIKMLMVGKGSSSADIAAWGDDVARDLSRIEAIWTEGVTSSGGPFLCGARFSAVDAMFAPVAFRLRTYNIHFASEPARQYAATLLALPGMREWQAAALAEEAAGLAIAHYDIKCRETGGPDRVEEAEGQAAAAST